MSDSKTSPELPPGFRDELILQIQEIAYEIKKFDPDFSYMDFSVAFHSEIKNGGFNTLPIADLRRIKSAMENHLSDLEINATKAAQNIKIEETPELPATVEEDKKLAAQEKLLATVGDQDIASGKQYFSLAVWGLMQKMADTFIKSLAIPSGIKNREQILMVLQAGYEKGMKPIESLQSFAIINGRISMFGAAVMNRLRRAGWTIHWNESTDKKCTMTITKGEEDYTESFTIEEARAAGLTDKEPWKKYPRNMLRFKCAGLHTRFNVPEVMENTPISEEAWEIPASDVEEKKEKVRGKKKGGQTIIDLP